MLNKLIFAPSCLGRRVYLPSGASTSVSYVDKCETTDGNFLSVPAFKHDFISVSHITKKKCSVNFFPEFFVLQDLSNGKVNRICKKIDGLYYFPVQKPCREKGMMKWCPLHNTQMHTSSFFTTI